MGYDPKEKTIGVIAGDETLRTFLSYAYGLKGHPVEEFSTGEQVAHWIDSSEYEHSFALIVLDIQLEDINGILLLEKVRKKVGQNTPIFVLSAFQQEEIIIEALQKGGSDFIVKPFSINYLLEKTSRALH